MVEDADVRNLDATRELRDGQFIAKLMVVVADVNSLAVQKVQKEEQNIVLAMEEAEGAVMKVVIELLGGSQDYV